MENNLYSSEVIKHFRAPLNVGEIPGADGVGEARNPDNGNVMKIWLRVKDGVIAEACFKTVGCAPVIACGSVLTDMVRGRTAEEAARVRTADVLMVLGRLPGGKMHAPRLALNALKEALESLKK
jgi:nitrogen fixation NifU-like protein